MSNDYDGDGSEDYFNDHDDDGNCTMDYVRDVKKKLPNPNLSSSNSSGGGVKGVTQTKNDYNGRGSGAIGVVNDRVIIKKLIELDYDVDAVVSFFKKKQQQSQKQQQQPTTTASMSSSSTINSNTSASGVKQPQTSKAKQSVMKQSSLVSNTDHDGDTSNSIIHPVTTVFSGTAAVVAATHESDQDPSYASLKQSRTHPALSDDEDVVDALKMMSIAPGNISGGQKHHQLDEAAEKVPHLTMVVTGHVDAGKSTLVGHLLFKCGLVSQKTMHKYEKESRAIGKGSFSFAWVTDEASAEREHGITIDLAERQLRTAHRLLTIIDSPGHKDFVPTMVRGAAMADVALLVVPATPGEFESSMKDNAQTREHATLLKAMGVSQVIVAMNKMDATLPTPWSHDRFSFIEQSMRQLLCCELRFDEHLIRCIPISGLTGQNLTSRDIDESCALLTQWYRGPTLLEAMDSFVIPACRSQPMSFRAVINDVLSVDKNRGRYEVGITVLQGAVSTRRTIACYTNSTATTAENSFSDGSQTMVVTGITQKKNADQGNTTIMMSVADGNNMQTRLRTGEPGLLQISSPHLKGTAIDLRPGSILFKGPVLPRQCTLFKATITTMSSIQPPIIPGSCFELLMYGIEVECIVQKLHSVRVRGGTSEGTDPSGKRPKCIAGSTTASVTINTRSRVVMDCYRDCNAIGRFVLRARGCTIAVGFCDKIMS